MAVVRREAGGKKAKGRLQVAKGSELDGKSRGKQKGRRQAGLSTRQ